MSDFMEHLRRQTLANNAGHTLWFCKKNHLIKRDGYFESRKCMGHKTESGVRS